MGYFGIGLVVLIITTFILSFFLISFFEQIMEYMKVNGYGYNKSNYDYYDTRMVMLFVPVGIIWLLSFFIWPVILISEFVGILYFIIRKEDKLKRMLEIWSEKDSGNLEK